MPDKPATEAGYRGFPQEQVRATCLQVATRLGSLMDDLVIVGGLVPSLLIDPGSLPPGVEAHVGTMDLDLGMELGLLGRERYRTLVEALRRGGFSMDVNERGNPTRQRWKSSEPGGVTVDFLIPPSGPDEKGGTLRDIEPDFAAVIATGLHLAFRDRCEAKDAYDLHYVVRNYGPTVDAVAAFRERVEDDGAEAEEVVTFVSALLKRVTIPRVGS